MTSIKEAIKIIKDIAREENIKPTDDAVLHSAILLYLSQNDKRPDSEQKATEKQISYLISLGYEGDTTALTKKEATTLIKEILENEK